MILLNNFLWFLPLSFIIHDFEEIILALAWKTRHHQLLTKFKFTPFGQATSTASLSVAIFEELLIFTSIAFIASLTGNYYIWFGSLFALTAHYLIHIGICIYFKLYVPGLITASLLLLPSIYILIKITSLTTFSPLILLISTAVVTFCFIINLRMLHKLMLKFNIFLANYSGTK